VLLDIYAAFHRQIASFHQNVAIDSFGAAEPCVDLFGGAAERECQSLVAGLEGVIANALSYL